MKKYQSHKIVEAAKILAVSLSYNPDIIGRLTLEGQNALGEALFADVDEEWLLRHSQGGEAQRLVGGYFVEYPGDGYTSWSPAEAFEQGYTELKATDPMLPGFTASYDPKDGALPVAGYKPQDEASVAMVNSFKADEERLLRKIDTLATNSATHPHVINANQRWLSIGRTALEQAFMAINRAVFQPGRAELPEDKTPSRDESN